MSDFSPADAGIPPNEESIPNLSLLNIHSSAEESEAPVMDSQSSKNQALLVDLHQDYIDRIVKFLDPKSLLRLQFTCRSLFQKGAAAQRLVELTPSAISYSDDPRRGPNKMRFSYWSEDPSARYKLNETQFNATGFRLRGGKLLVDGDFTPAICDYIDGQLNGRGTIRELNFEDDASTVDAVRFNKFLQNFQISELDVETLPVNYFVQPCVQKLEDLSYRGNFPLTLQYFVDSATHSGFIKYRHEGIDFDDLSLLLKKWAVNEKLIKRFEFVGRRRGYFDEEKAFGGWRVVDGEGEIPAERPVVLRDRLYRFRLLRADETTLYIDFSWGNLTLSTSCYPLEFFDSSDDDYFGGGGFSTDEDVWYDSGDDVYYSSNAS